jgi:hypothetical protein
MPKPLTYYIGSRDDNVIAIQLQPFVDKMPDSFKLQLAFSTLHMVIRPNQPCPFIPQLTAQVMIASNLSRQGKAELVRALMEQVNIR